MLYTLKDIRTSCGICGFPLVFSPLLVASRWEHLETTKTGVSCVTSTPKTLHKYFKKNVDCILALQELSPFLLFLSYFSSCPMKFKLGEMTGLRSLTNLYASPRQRPCRFIMYATVTVAERDTPAWQCTRTPLPCSRASSTEENSKSTIRFHVAICTTWRYTCMTKPLISMAWNVNHRTSVTWLQTQICHFWSHFGFWRLTQLYQLFDRCV